MAAVSRVTGGSQQSNVRRLLYGVIIGRPYCSNFPYLGDTTLDRARVASAGGGVVRLNVMETGATIDGGEGRIRPFSAPFRSDAAHFRCLVMPTDGVWQAMPIICRSVRRTAARRAKNASVPIVRSKACYLGLWKIQSGRDKSRGMLSEVIARMAQHLGHTVQ